MVWVRYSGRVDGCGGYGGLDDGGLGMVGWVWWVGYGGLGTSCFASVRSRLGAVEGEVPKRTYVLLIIRSIRGWIYPNPVLQKHQSKQVLRLAPITMQVRV